MKTTIEWADESTTPVIGCTKISAGCQRCYAATMAGSLATRFGSKSGARYLPVIDGRGGWNGRVVVDRWYMARTRVPHRTREPDGTMRPARIFDVSMGDMFHEALTVEDVADVWEWMGRSRLGRSGTRRGPTRIVVTKRPERAAELLPQLAELLDARGVPWPVVHLLTTVERQDYAAPRLDALVRCARHVRLLGVSAEPLLGPLDLRPWLDHLGWVIVGAESGTGARPMRVGWAADLLYQCQAAGMPMFVKQLGSRPIIGEGEATWAVARREWPGPHHGAEPPVVHDRSTGLVTAWLSRKGGDPSQWPERLRVREWPAP